MDPLKVAAQFAAYAWFCNRNKEGKRFCKLRPNGKRGPRADRNARPLDLPLT
jgi:hypothetical protein